MDKQLDEILSHLIARAERRLGELREQPVGTAVDLPGLTRELAERFDFTHPVAVEELVPELRRLLEGEAVQSAHPRYFGLFNPPSLPATVAADALVALFNPQVGTWTHAPIANLVEQHVLGFLAGRIGMVSASAHFTSGGQEANTTAVAAAISARFPQAAKSGLMGLAKPPRLYVSEHAHHSMFRAATLLGLGSDAVVQVLAEPRAAMRLDDLAARVCADREAGREPFLVVGTAGTTGLGSIDPLRALGEFANAQGLWYHVDAAWGGSALLSPRLAPQLDGIASADSVTWDAHKWMSVPMGAGMFFTRHRAPLERTFGISTGYVPKPAGDWDEPYTMTAQWSRRFIGLKVFAALATLSATGYAALIEHQADMGECLRERLRAAGWTIVNTTALPLVCFSHPDANAGALAEVLSRIEERGRVWISRLTLPSGETMLRACITSFDTQTSDLDVLMEELQLAWQATTAGG